ncbi:unnamed protein product [Clonostachys rosea]|uniref:Zn(2)-C6 fungal-type domain-containing protein n=1 Tax=Bionectria ochroleuca TaxID=29856 RepID=A0ABY6UEW0_BIOOC|nr:unnamed protein product [Clonostachys rosea]
MGPNGTDVARTVAHSSMQKTPVRRSRKGCGNCKLRKVKCDQAKPQCQRCLSYGVVCNYGKDVRDLRLPKESQHLWLAQEMSPILPSKDPISTEAGLKKHNVTSQMDASSLRLLSQLYHKMKSTSVFPVADTFHLAQGYPFLMDAALALSAAYDRSLSMARRCGQGRTMSEIAHAFRCTAALNRKLCHGISPADRDPIWATASFLSILSFLALDECDPSKAWPFKPSESDDMNWLRLGDTKWKLFQLTKPDRPGSIFYPMSGIYQKMRAYRASSTINNISPELQFLCRLGECSQPESSPYFEAAEIITRLGKWRGSEIPFTEAMAFIIYTSPSFKSLLLMKDPIALVLLALWYSKARKTIWWVDLRAATELEAICMYLRQYYSNDLVIMGTLRYISMERHHKRIYSIKKTALVD